MQRLKNSLCEARNHTSRRVFDNERVVAQLLGVQGRVEHAVIQRQARDEDRVNAMAFEPCIQLSLGKSAIVEKCRIRINLQF